MPGRAAVDLDMCEAAAPQIVSLIGNDVTLRHKRSGETQRLANMSGDGEAAAIGKFFEPDRQRRAGTPADGDLVMLNPLLVDAKNADISRMMVATAIDAAGNINLQPADRGTPFRIAKAAEDPVGEWQ